MCLWLLPVCAHPRCLPPAILLPSQVGDLLSVPLGSYFDVPQGVLPEATHDYYKDPVLKVCMPAFSASRCGTRWCASNATRCSSCTRARCTAMARAALPPPLNRTQGENVHEPNYGCKAVQQEWEWSGRRSLLARACMRDLAQSVQASLRFPQFCLIGPKELAAATATAALLGGHIAGPCSGCRSA